MIRAELWHLPLLYAGVLSAALLAAWVVSDWRRRRTRRRERGALCQCRLCAEWIRPPGRETLVRCPVCGALNEPQRTDDI
jgi:uncharacterized membrane protein YccC